MFTGLSPYRLLKFINFRFAILHNVDSFTHSLYMWERLAYFTKYSGSPQPWRSWAVEVKGGPLNCEGFSEKPKRVDTASRSSWRRFSPASASGTAPWEPSSVDNCMDWIQNTIEHSINEGIPLCSQKIYTKFRTSNKAFAYQSMCSIKKIPAMISAILLHSLMSFRVLLLWWTWREMIFRKNFTCLGYTSAMLLHKNCRLTLCGTSPMSSVSWGTLSTDVRHSAGCRPWSMALWRATSCLKRRVVLLLSSSLPELDIQRKFQWC